MNYAAKEENAFSKDHDGCDLVDVNRNAGVAHLQCSGRIEFNLSISSKRNLILLRTFCFKTNKAPAEASALLFINNSF